MKQETKEELVSITERNSNLKKELNNEVVGHIYFKNLDRVKAFEETFPHFVLYRATRAKREYIDFNTGQIWYTLVYNENNCLGRRFYRAIVDSAINDEEGLIVPMTYCFDIQFFD